VNDDTPVDKALLKFAIGFERYAFGAGFVLESESWKEAEAKIKDYLAARKTHGGEASLYFEPDKTLWREYQFLFLCQLVEFKLAELIDRLRRAGNLKTEFITKLQESPKANRERARKVSRLTSPASLLEDFGYGLGQLTAIIRDETLPFDQRDCLLEELNEFNKDRVKFIHHSFGGKETAGTDIVDALRSGKFLLKRLEALIDVRVEAAARRRTFRA
jgi:hypothetical protein